MFACGQPGACLGDESGSGDPATAVKTGVRLYTPEVAATVEDALKFLASRQQRSGAIGKDAQVATTSLAGLAFLSAGNTLSRGRYAKILKNCVDFLLKSQNLNGYYNHPGDALSRMHGHGFAIMFLAEAYGTSKPGPTERFNKLDNMKSSLKCAVNLAVQSQSPEGGWNYQPGKGSRGHEGSITVCVVEGLRAARNAGIAVPNGTIDRAVEYMKKSWDGKASFQYRLGQSGPSSFALAAAGACVLLATGDQSPEVQKMIKLATHFVRSKPAGVTRETSQRFWFYGYFYATQAMFVRGGDDWAEWYRDISKWLLDKKVATPNGCYWVSPSNEASGDKGFATAMALLILQMPNQYLPIFQR
ncbi:prenyltransferase/squalene oxidase repeat-containing protein [Planctomycetota bacterium]